MWTKVIRRYSGSRLYLGYLRVTSRWQALKYLKPDWWPWERANFGWILCEFNLSSFVWIQLILKWPQRYFSVESAECINPPLLIGPKTLGGDQPKNARGRERLSVIEPMLVSWEASLHSCIPATRSPLQNPEWQPRVKSEICH